MAALASCRRAPDSSLALPPPGPETLPVRSFLPDRGALNWLREKVLGDSIDSRLWRVHDDLYDLTGFIDKHPGGPKWLELTRGTDITEAFEVVHIFEGKVKEVLEKYHMRSCKEIPRKSTFTFRENGFYKTLKRRAQKTLKEVGTGPSSEMLLIQDSLALLFHLLLVAAVYTSGSWVFVMLAALVLGMSTASAHNFFHQRDNFRMHYFDLSLFNSTDWRASHMLSHHLYTNTYKDYEISAFYPIADWFPTKNKNWVHKYLSPIYVHIFFAGAPLIQFANKLVSCASGVDKFTWQDALPLTQLAALSTWSGLSLSSCLVRWVVMHAVCGYWITFTSLIATHQDPSSYHAGDNPCHDTDWGIHQFDSTNDVEKKQALKLKVFHANLMGKGLVFSFLVVASTFGDHLLHHLFPTVDHSKLKHLYPDLYKTCEEFGVTHRFGNPLKLAISMHSQLSRDRGHTYEDRKKMKP